MPSTWWTSKRHYVTYMLREFTAVPMAAWLLWFLVEIKRAGDGPARYSPHESTAFVIFSVVCFAFATYHSYTFLNLAGVIMRVKLMGRTLPPRIIVLTMFSLWAVASIVIAAVLIGFAR